jgi:hypothetical protein
MAVSISTVGAPAPSASVSEAGRSSALATEWTIYAVVFASASIVVGLIWDISWHRTIGRDTFWSPPHLLEQAGAIVSGISCGYLVLRTTFADTGDARNSAVTYWKYFRGPLGAWVCIWGSLMMIASAPFDNWWHNAYGLDVKIISPPHAVLASGMIAIQLGAMLMALAAQNRSENDLELRRLARVFTLSAALLVTMALTVVMEEAAYPNEMHSSKFYVITAYMIPLFLVAFARASRVSWPATRIAVVYMIIGLLAMWILQLFPGSPRLAPIYNVVTHMVPPPFPLLLVFPAIAVDLLMKRFGDARDWRLAALIGLAFVAVMAVVHWPWAEFMLTPASRNFFFGGDIWDYTARPGPWRYEFWGLDARPGEQWSPDLFVVRMAIAVAIAFVMARFGLALGKGLVRVRR